MPGRLGDGSGDESGQPDDPGGSDDSAGPSPEGVPTTGTPPLADASLPAPEGAGALREKVEDVVGKDGIPAIDDPSFVVPGGADFLADGDPVFGV